MRVWGLVLAVGALLAIGGAASAGNNQVYTDPVGDYEKASDTAYASDITQVQATSQDNGDTKISTTLADGFTHMSNGDELDVYVNVDRRANTGQTGTGFDIVLIAQGTPTTASFQLCRFQQPFTCEAGATGFGADRAAGTAAHVVEFNVRTATPAVDLMVVSSFPRPGGGNDLIDRAPNSGVYTFNIGADKDGDGVNGYLDLCPTKRARGINDVNHNGCPGLFSFIRAFRRQVAVPFSSYLLVRRLAFEGTIPGGARALISGGGRRESRAATPNFVRSRRFQGRLGYGTRLVVRITKPGWIGFYAEYRVTRRSGLVPTRTACLPAIGSQTPTRCSNALRGK
jgi:hypothetical protein